MFEGKNLHFSPVDNKPLCSYSSKLCRQRRLNGYGFCIRHILEDKSSPFKQCEFVTRNNASRCLNAIPVDQERGYCHSHMQVAGIIPKTERKVKPTANDGTSATSKTKNGNATPAASPARKNATSVQTKDPAASGIVKQSVQSHQLPLVPIKSKAGGVAPVTHPAVSPTAVSNPSIAQRAQNVKSGVQAAKSPKIAIITPITVTQSSRPSKLAKNNKGGAAIKVPSPAIKTSQPRVVMTSPGVATPKPPKKSAKITPFMQPITSISTPATTTISNKPGPVKKSTPVVKISVTSTTISNLPDMRPQSAPSIGINDHWKTFQFNPQELKLNQKSSSKLNHLNSVRLVEKAPLFNAGSATLVKDKFAALPSDLRLPQRLEIQATEPGTVTLSHLQSRKKVKTEQEECMILDETDGLVKKLTVKGDCIVDDKPAVVTGENKYQARRDFLAKVRKSMKKQCETIKKAYKLYEEEDQYEKSYRTALLTVAEQDASMCAKLLQKPVSFVKPAVKVELSNQKKPAQVSKPKISITATTAKNHPDMRLGDINLNKTNTIINTKTGVKAKKEVGTVPPLLPPMSEDNTLDHNDSTFITPSGQTCMWNNMPPSDSILKKKNEMPFTGMPKLRNDKIKIKSLTIEHVQIRPNQSSVENFISKQKKSAVNSKPRRKRKLDETRESSEESTAPKKQTSVKCVVTKRTSTGMDKMRHASLGTTGSSGSYESNLNSVGSSDAATTPEGLQDGSFDSPFDNSTSSHPECDFSDDDLEQSFDLPIIDPDIAQATRLLEDTGFTDEEWNDLFHSSDQKHNGGRTDLTDLGLDFVPGFDTGDIDYSIFSNIFPPFRSTPPEISISQPF